MKSLTWACRIVAIGVLATGSLSSIFELTTNEACGASVELTTTYLQQPIGRARQVRIKAELEGSGKLFLDPNTCTLNEFGDRTICTRIAVQTVDIVVTQLRLADPTGKQRQIFEITAPDSQLKEQLFLVVPRQQNQPCRLIVVAEESKRRTITLERVNSRQEQPAALCNEARYSAVQREDTVVITATGHHPTSGWEAEFEQLPIRIFPPQYRLNCKRPSGIVAQVITPFKAETSFRSNGKVENVVVHDARGQHRVPVQQEK